ncbi:unnamed protein product, partial [Sphacelaria rigidula]
MSRRSSRLQAAKLLLLQFRSALRKKVAAVASMGDTAAAVGDSERVGPTWTNEQVLVGGGPSCLLPPDQRKAGNTPCMLEGEGGCYSRIANEEGEQGACRAHGESICASDMAGDRSDDSEGCLFEGQVGAGLAELPPEQRVAVDTPCMIKTTGACDPREAGTQSELQARDAVSDHYSDGDDERRVVLRWSCALLFTWTALAYLAAMAEVSPLFRRGVFEEDSVPSGGVAVR